MTALSANAGREIRNDLAKSKQSYIVKTGAKIYANALVMQTANGSVTPCADSTTAKFAGLAIEEQLTGNGTRRVEVVDDIEIRIFLMTTVTVGLVGTIAYAKDDNAITNLATQGPQVGTITERIAANDGWVKLRRAVMAKGT